MIGETLSHYKILDKLGAGGMGEVYRAEDTTLDREVALKILPPELAESQERLDRFQREAKTLAALDHPNIVTVFTVEQAKDVHFLTMQLVEGKPLSQLIPRGGMPLERIFDVAIPLADALATAHETRVIHRDLKPANIMVTDEGRVKVLDFGLAKLREEMAPGKATELPTEPLTEEGRALGTVPYMSPEQVEGRPVDERSDLFSLGVILFEMATGQRPFQGDSPASVMSAILRDTPSSVTELRSVLPRQLARIIRRCLVKEPERRFQTARELAIELDELRSEVASGEAWGMSAPHRKRRRVARWAGLGAVGMVSLAALAVLFWVLRPDREAAESDSAKESATFTNLVFDTATKGKVSASPDGRYFVYASDAVDSWDIYLRRISGGRAINLTEDSPEDDKQPAFSPDGEWIAFRSEREGGGIFVMGATGETVRRVTDHGYYPDWSPDGTKIVFSTSASVDLNRWSGDSNHRIWILDLPSGDLERVLDHSALMPAWSPDGRWIAFYAVWGSPGTEAEIQYDLFTVPAGGGTPNAVTEDAQFEHSPAWSPDGRSLYYVTDAGGSRDLWRVSIDELTGKRLGDPERMTSGSSVAHISPSGGRNRVLYTAERAFREILGVPFDPVTEKVTGPPVSITPPGLQARHPAVSADGEWIAFSAEFGHFGSFSIGVVRRDGSGLRQVTESGARDHAPDWSPDGQRLAFYSNRSSRPFGGWIVNADGGGLWLMTDSPGFKVGNPKWSPDGLQLSWCNSEAHISSTDKPWSEEPPTQLPPVGEDYNTFCPGAWSRDGKILAGVVPRQPTDEIEYLVAVYSFDTQRYQVLTAPLPGVDGLDDVRPQWLSDGRRLFFKSRGGDGAYSILDTETGEQHEVLTGENLAIGRNGRAYIAMISPDNRNFYVHWSYSESNIRMLTLGKQK
ncbi:MAG: protein kinase [Thermoanaerobaculia bacterium]